MPIQKELFKNSDHSVTLHVHLGDYLPLFRHMNACNLQGIAVSEHDKNAFKKLRSQLSEQFNGFLGANLFEDLFDMALEHYSEIQREQDIKPSPACRLLHDSGLEIIKNTIDAFLEYQLNNPSNSSNTMALNLKIIDEGHHIKIIFSDNGPGFSAQSLRQWSNREEQLSYIKRHRSSPKSHRSNPTPTIGLMGGAGQGMRHLIHQILTGKEFGSHHQSVTTEPFDSSIQFKNNTTRQFPGAAIIIETQKKPLEHQAISGELDDDLFVLNSPRSTPKDYSPVTIIETDPDFSSSEDSFDSQSTLRLFKTRLDNIKAEKIKSEVATLKDSKDKQKPDTPRP